MRCYLHFPYKYLLAEMVHCINSIQCYSSKIFNYAKNQILKLKKWHFVNEYENELVNKNSYPIV